MGGLDNLPVGVQVFWSVLAFLGSAVVYFAASWRKDKLERAKDLVVPSINILDAQAFREASDTLKRFMTEDEDRRRMVRDMRQEQLEQTNLLRRIAELDRQKVSLLESIDERLREQRRP